MPYNLALPLPLRRQGWKAKIREKERLETPHVSIILRTKTWRFDLRESRFLDRVPRPREVPAPLRTFLRRNLAVLRQAWDDMYPENPVGDDQ